MSCLSKIGCLAVAGLVVVAGAGAWWLYGGVVPSFVPAIGDASRSAAAEKLPVAWSPLAAKTGTAQSTRDALERADGPAFVTLSTEELAGLLSDAFNNSLPESARGVQLAIDGELIRLRSEVPLRELGTLLGPIGGLLSDRDTIELAGTLDVLRPGLAQFHVRELHVKGIAIPPRLIPPLIGALHKRARGTAGLPDSVKSMLAPDALPVPLPKAVADVRIARGRLTLYKAVLER